MSPGLIRALVTAVAVSQAAACTTMHSDDMDSAIGKTAQGFGSLLEGIGGELRTRIWQRSDATAPSAVPAAHPAPATRQ